jgi:hypothetical protein
MTKRFFSSSISAKLKPSVEAMAQSGLRWLRISSGQRSMSWRRKPASCALKCRVTVIVIETKIDPNEANAVDMADAQPQFHSRARAPRLGIPVAHEDLVHRQKFSIARRFEERRVELIEIDSHRRAETRNNGNALDIRLVIDAKGGEK